jgi:hypothetical protein
MRPRAQINHYENTTHDFCHGNGRHDELPTSKD